MRKTQRNCRRLFVTVFELRRLIYKYYTICYGLSCPEFLFVDFLPRKVYTINSTVTTMSHSSSVPPTKGLIERRSPSSSLHGGTMKIQPPQRTLFRSEPSSSILSTLTNSTTKTNTTGKGDGGKGLIKTVDDKSKFSRISSSPGTLSSRTTQALRQRLVSSISTSSVRPPSLSTGISTGTIVNKPPVPKYLPKDTDALHTSPSSGNPLLLCQRLNIYARIRPFLPYEESTSTSSRNFLNPIPVPLSNESVSSRITVDKQEHMICIWPVAEDNLSPSTIRSKGTSTNNSSSVEPKKFIFDNVYTKEQKQAEIHRETTAPAIEEVLNGNNSVILVYGQTGSGKTYTVFGPDTDATRVGAKDASQLGLIPRAIHDIYERVTIRNDRYRQQQQNIQRSRTNSIDSHVSISAFSTNVPNDYDDENDNSKDDSIISDTENNDIDKYIYVSIRYCQLYQDSWIDLLANETVGETSVSSSSSSFMVPTVSSPVVATTLPCSDVRTVLQLLHKGSKKKIVAATSMNTNSSRGHTVFQILITKPTPTESSSSSLPSPTVPTTSTLTFMDLAGSERIGRSNAQGITLNEARFINKSLHALGVCLTALATSALRTALMNNDRQQRYENNSVQQHQASLSSTFIPWRSSKLTRFLQSCIGESDSRHNGYCLPSTLSLIVCLSPTEASIPETLSTLTFASRARAYAEALAGNVLQAKTLLQEDAHRAVVLSSSSSTLTNNNEEQLTTSLSPVPSESVRSNIQSSVPNNNNPFPLPSSTSSSNNVSEIEAVLDRQRTQIGSLTQQYEALLASHMQLQERLLQAEQVANNARNEATNAVNETHNIKLLEYSNSRLAATAITASKALGDDTIALQLEATIAAAIESGNEEVLRAAVEEAARVSAQYTHHHLQSPIIHQLSSIYSSRDHRFTKKMDEDNDSRAGDFDDHGPSLLQQLSALDNDDWEKDSLYSVHDKLSIPSIDVIHQLQEIGNSLDQLMPLSLEELSKVPLPLSPLTLTTAPSSPTDTLSVPNNYQDVLFTSPEAEYITNIASESVSLPVITDSVPIIEASNKQKLMLLTPGYEVATQTSTNTNTDTYHYRGTASLVKNLLSVEDTPVVPNVTIELSSSNNYEVDAENKENIVNQNNENGEKKVGPTVPSVVFDTASLPSRRGSTPNTVDLLDILELEKELLSNSIRVQEYEHRYAEPNNYKDKDNRSQRTSDTVSIRDDASVISDYRSQSSLNNEHDQMTVGSTNEEQVPDHDLDLSIIKAGGIVKEHTAVHLTVPTVLHMNYDDSTTERNSVSPLLSSIESNHSSPVPNMDENHYDSYPNNNAPYISKSRNDNGKDSLRKQYRGPPADVLDIPLSPDIITPIHYRTNRAKKQQNSSSSTSWVVQSSQKIPAKVVSPSQKSHYSQVHGHELSSNQPFYHTHEIISPVIVSSTPNPHTMMTPATLLQEISPITNRTTLSYSGTLTPLSSIVSPTSTVNLSSVTNTMMSPEKNQALLVVQAALERAQGVLSRLNDLRSKRTNSSSSSTSNSIEKMEKNDEQVSSIIVTKGRRGRGTGTPSTRKRKPKVVPPTIPEATEEDITKNASTVKRTENESVAPVVQNQHNPMINRTDATENIGSMVASVTSTKNEVLSSVSTALPMSLSSDPTVLQKGTESLSIRSASASTEIIPSALSSSTMNINELQPVLVSSVLNTTGLNTSSLVNSNGMDDVLKIAATVAEVVATRIVQAMTTNLSVSTVSSIPPNTNVSMIKVDNPSVTVPLNDVVAVPSTSPMVESTVATASATIFDVVRSSSTNPNQDTVNKKDVNMVHSCSSSPIIAPTSIVPQTSTVPIIPSSFHRSTQSSPFIPITINSTIQPSTVSRSSSPIKLSTSGIVVPLATAAIHLSTMDASTAPIIHTIDQSTETDTPFDESVSNGKNISNDRRNSVGSTLSMNFYDKSRNSSPFFDAPNQRPIVLPSSSQQTYGTHSLVLVEDHPVILIIDDSDSDSDDDNVSNANKRSVTPTVSVKSNEVMNTNASVPIQPTSQSSSSRRSSVSTTSTTRIGELQLQRSIRKLESQLAHEVAAVANAVDNERRRNSVSSIRSVLSNNSIMNQSIGNPPSRRQSWSNISPTLGEENREYANNTLTALPSSGIAVTLSSRRNTSEVDELTLALMNTKAALAKALVSLEEDEDIKLALQNEPPVVSNAVNEPVTTILSTTAPVLPVISVEKSSLSLESSPTKITSTEKTKEIVKSESLSYAVYESPSKQFSSFSEESFPVSGTSFSSSPNHVPQSSSPSASFLSTLDNTANISSTTVTPSSSPPPPPVQPPRPQLPLAQTKPETARGINSVNSFQYHMMSGTRSSLFDSKALREGGQYTDPKNSLNLMAAVPTKTENKLITSPPPLRRSSKPEIIFSHTVPTVSIEPKPVPFETALMDIPAPLPSLNVRAPTPLVPTNVQQSIPVPVEKMDFVPSPSIETSTVLSSSIANTTSSANTGITSIPIYLPGQGVVMVPSSMLDAMGVVVDVSGTVVNLPPPLPPPVSVPSTPGSKHGKTTSSTKKKKKKVNIDPDTNEVVIPVVVSNTVGPMTPQNNISFNDTTIYSSTGQTLPPPPSTKPPPLPPLSKLSMRKKQ